MMRFLYFSVLTSYLLIIVIYIPFALECVLLGIPAPLVKPRSAAVRKASYNFIPEISSVRSSA